MASSMSQAIALYIIVLFALFTSNECKYYFSSNFIYIYHDTHTHTHIYFNLLWILIPFIHEIIIDRWYVYFIITYLFLENDVNLKEIYINTLMQVLTITGIWLCKEEKGLILYQIIKPHDFVNPIFVRKLVVGVVQMAQASLFVVRH